MLCRGHPSVWSRWRIHLCPVCQGTCAASEHQSVQRVRPALNERQWAAMQHKQHKGTLGLWEKLFGMYLFRKQCKQLYISIFSKYWKFHIWMTLSFCTCQRSFQVCNEPFLIISVSVRFSGKAFIFCTLLYKYRFVTVYTKRDVWGKWHILKCTLGLLKEKKCYLCLSQVYL